MSAFINLSGKKFNRLTVLKRSEKNRKAGALWVCLCDCGEETLVDSYKLRSGSTKSCGCHRKEVFNHTTHGFANKTKTYRSWKEMRNRCRNPNADNYAWYGGRGVRVCSAWDAYTVFLADMGERPDGTTLDRIDSDGNYEPGNCKWSTPKEQAKTNRGCFRKGR